ncbi:MAG TPA: plasma-membrane proton-efflux P-type ATPase [Phototrophicaceae bacterium]|nr:plasma-membrane proton-efflux P-type ATPase [Phototrophicaceae bacterium]
MIGTLDLKGLSRSEVEARRQQYGANQIEEAHSSTFRLFLSKFWGIIPWMLEGTLLLQCLLGKMTDALIIGLLLIVNAVIGYSYERKARSSLAALQQRLTIQTRVLRAGEWQLIPAQELVPDDIVRLRVGDIVPADVQIIEGQIAVDQSMLTGESELVELEPDGSAYAASVIRRGESVARVSAIGMQTTFSKTASLIQMAKTTDHGDVFVHRIVLYLMGFTSVLMLIVMLYTLAAHLLFVDALPFTLALLIAAVPVSLPVTFTLATAVGSRELARHGVLATRLAAIKEAAGMDVLCTDKTGTITRNVLRVVAVRPYHAYTKKKLLRLAALASDEATHDPIDIAIVSAARNAELDYGKSRRVEFTPFDPATKRTEAMIRKGKKRVRILKGAPFVIDQMVHDTKALTADIEQFSADGSRCIAVAVGKEDKALKLAGLLALQDPPRDDAALVVARLRALGVRVLMITGDNLETARSIAQHVGITGEVGTADDLRAGFGAAAEQFDIFARVYPEDKYKLVQALQAAGHIVGMTGDGINDAPAIRQADIGVAVNNATDIAKLAASLVLTAPGLQDMLAAVEIGRSIFQRISTYTLNKIVKTFHLGLFLTLGLILTGTLIALPIHILLVVLTNDLVSMSLTTDRVRASAKPDRWQVRPLILCGLALAAGWLLFSFGIYAYGRAVLRLDADGLETLVFLMLVCVSQANVYLVREKRHFWSSRPSTWTLLATALDLCVVSLLVLSGTLMTALTFRTVVALFASTFVFMLVLDAIKVRVWRYQVAPS